MKKYRKAIQIWTPHPLDVIANNKRNVEIQEARKRIVFINGVYQLKPSQEYLTAKKKFDSYGKHRQIHKID